MIEPKTIKAVDISSGVETHVEGYLKDGILHITYHYEVINGTPREPMIQLATQQSKQHNAETE